MAHGFKHGGGSSGGGTSLGFEIVGGTTRPTKPTQNMVWVNTDVDITSYAFSATDPIADSLVEGAGTVLGTIEGRTYTKANAGRAAWAFVCVDGFTGPMLVSPDKDACVYSTSGDHVSTIGSVGNVVHNGVTYYYSTGAWMYGNRTGGISPAFTASSEQEAALLLARTYDPEGMLWVTIANSSRVKSVFTVDKEWVTLYLVSVKQYIDGAWVGKPAMSYQDGEWVDWFTGELFKDGTDYEGVSGGWYATNNGTQLVFTIPILNAKEKKLFTNKKAINLTPYSTLTINVSAKSDDIAHWCIGILESPANGLTTESLVVEKRDAYMSVGEHVLDVSSLSGNYYIGVGIDRSDGGTTSKAHTMNISAITLK